MGNAEYLGYPMASIDNVYVRRAELTYHEPHRAQQQQPWGRKHELALASSGCLPGGVSNY